MALVSGCIDKRCLPRQPREMLPWSIAFLGRTPAPRNKNDRRLSIRALWSVRELLEVYLRWGARETGSVCGRLVRSEPWPSAVCGTATSP